MKTYLVHQVANTALMWGVFEIHGGNEREVCRFYHWHEAQGYAGVRTWAASGDE